MQLDWWRPDICCFREGVCVGEVLMRVLRLPVHCGEKSF